MMNFLCSLAFLSSLCSPTLGALSIFTSGQVGATPTNGYVLQTNGTNSTWVATSTLGFGSGSANTFSYPLVDTAGLVSLAFGTTTTNTWSNLQTFTSGISINGETVTDFTGTGITIVGGALTASGGGSGTVTQIDTTYPVTGGSITTTGTIGLAFGTTTSNTWADTQTFGTSIHHSVKADASDGLLIESNNGTDVGIFGAGNTANSLFYGGVNIDGATRLATSLTGLLKATSGAVSTATADVDYQVPLTFGDGLTRTVDDVDCDTASGSVFGCLSSIDWTTFNNKQSAITFGANVLTALGVDVGTAGAFVVNGGALGTPSSGTLTNATGLPPAGINLTKGNFLVGDDAGVAQATSTIFISSTGKVGIGTSTPNSTLNLASTANTRLTLTDTDATANSKHFFIESNADKFSVGTTSDALITSTSRALTILNTGFVGVGTTNPVQNFVVSDGGAAGLEVAVTSAATAQCYNRGSSAYCGLTFDGSTISFRPSGSAMMSITSTGVGIGTTSPYAKLSVVNNAAGTPALVVKGASAQSANLTEWQNSASTPVVQFANTGHVAFNIAPIVTDTIINVAGGNNERVDTTGTARGIDMKVINASSGNIVGLNFIGETRYVGTTGNVTGALAQAITNNAGNTLTYGTAYQAASPSVLAGAITTARGLYIEAQKITGVTTGYSIYSGGASDVAYFAGTIGIGTTTPTYKLSVEGISSLGNQGIAGYFTATTTATSTFAGGIQGVTGYFTTLLESVNTIVTTILRIPYGTSPTVATNGDIGIDSTSNQFKFFSGGAVKVLGNGNVYPAFTYSTTTAWTGTTTIPLGTAYVGETWNGVQCFTDTGTLGVSFYDGTNRMTYVPTASTTVNTNALTTNNTFTATEKRYVDVGTPASSPTKISCTVSKSISPD